MSGFDKVKQGTVICSTYSSCLGFFLLIKLLIKGPLTVRMASCALEVELTVLVAEAVATKVKIN